MSLFSQRERPLLARATTLLLFGLALAGLAVPIAAPGAAQQKAKKPAAGELGRYLGF